MYQAEILIISYEILLHIVVPAAYIYLLPVSSLRVLVTWNGNCWLLIPLIISPTSIIYLMPTHIRELLKRRVICSQNCSWNICSIHFDKYFAHFTSMLQKWMFTFSLQSLYLWKLNKCCHCPLYTNMIIVICRK